MYWQLKINECVINVYENVHFGIIIIHMDVVEGWIIQTHGFAKSIIAKRFIKIRVMVEIVKQIELNWYNWVQKKVYM